MPRSLLGYALTGVLAACSDADAPPRVVVQGSAGVEEYSNLLVDDEGNLWVQEYASSFFAELATAPQRWSVLDRQG